jgi:hypothetical protein
MLRVADGYRVGPGPPLCDARTATPLLSNLTNPLATTASTSLPPPRLYQHFCIESPGAMAIPPESGRATEALPAAPAYPMPGKNGIFALALTFIQLLSGEASVTLPFLLHAILSLLRSC